MNNIIPFSFETHEVRVVMLDNTPWFSARDVTIALGYTNPSEAYSDHCKLLNKLSYSKLLELKWVNPNPQGEYTIPKADVLRLIVKSKKPEAERFEKWVFEEVLPSVLTTGSYNAPTTPGEQAVRIAQETMRVGTALGMPLAHTQRLAFQRIADETGIHYTLPPIEKTPPATKKPSSSHPYIQPIANYLAQRNGATVTVSEVKTALNLPIHNTAIGRILSGLGRTIHIACVNGRTTRFWN